VRAITIGTNSKICPNCKGEGTVSPPEPVKPVEGLLLTDEEFTEYEEKRCKEEHIGFPAHGEWRDIFNREAQLANRELLRNWRLTLGNLKILK
jgi:hypothetical protein